LYTICTLEVYTICTLEVYTILSGGSEVLETKLAIRTEGW